MKNYRVKATRTFTDGVENIERIGGESIFECTKERYEFLKSKNAVELVEVIEEEKEQKVVEVTEYEMEKPFKKNKKKNK